jgi:hypothetical protein
MEKLLTVNEAATRAGVSESLVYQWIDERLTHFRLGPAFWLELELIVGPGAAANGEAGQEARP